MDLSQYLRYGRQWLWLIALAALLGGTAMLVRHIRQTPAYIAETTLAVGSFLEAPSPAQEDIATPKRLVYIYAELAQSPTILQAAISASHLAMGVEMLQPRVTIRVVPNTALLTIRVLDIDRVRAATLANQIAVELIRASPRYLTPLQAAEVDYLKARVASQNAEILRLQAELAQLERLMANEPDLEDWNRLATSRNYVADQLSQLETSVATSGEALSTIHRQTNRLRVVQPAREPERASRPGRLKAVARGVLMGGVLGLLAALGIEALNTRVRLPHEVAPLAGVPLLGIIMRFGPRRISYPQRLVTALQPMSSAAERYRLLRTNVLQGLFRHYPGREKWALIVTSAERNAGKSVTAANLAVTMASAGLEVLLVDADLRRPALHRMFDLPNDLGLTSLLHTDPALLADWATGEPDELPLWLQDAIQPTNIKRLRVLTSGILPANPTTLLGSTLMVHWYERLLASPAIDMMIFDTPPALTVPDSSILAERLGVPVVLVVRGGQTSRQWARALGELHRRQKLPVLGVILNAARAGNLSAGYGYEAGMYDYYDQKEGEHVRNRR